jgi:hypothetical protein
VSNGLAIGGIPRSPSLPSASASWSRSLMKRFPSLGALLYGTCALELNWFLRDFDYDTELLVRIKSMKSTPEPSGVIRTTFTNLNGRSYQNLDAFAPARRMGGTLLYFSNASTPRKRQMRYSYTQLASYLRCPQVIVSISRWLARKTRGRGLWPLFRTGPRRVFLRWRLFKEWGVYRGLRL